MLQALALGDKSGFTSARWQTFIHTGTTYLLVISGLHLGMLAMAVYAVVRKLWASSWLIRRYSAQQAATFLAMLAACFYGALTGMVVPTQRAVLMLSVMGVGLCCRRRVSIGWAFFLAAVIVVLIDPLTVGQAGTWLSFVAVAWLLWGYAHYQPEKWWQHLLYAQWLLFCL